MNRIARIVIMFFLVLTFAASCGGNEEGTAEGTAVSSDEGAGGSESSTALSFDLANVVGIVKIKDVSSGKSLPMYSLLSKGSEEGIDTSQPFKKITDAGEIKDFIFGSIPIKEVYVSPAGDLYLLLSSRATYTTTDGSNGVCILFKVAKDNSYKCIDSSLESVGIDKPWQYQSPPVQFDGNGAIYYVGDRGVNTVLVRQKADGSTTDLITEHMGLDDFIVVEDGTVYLHGSTAATSAYWLRKLDASGLHDLAGSESNILWMTLFPDKNIYFGSHRGGISGSYSGFSGIVVIDVLAGSIRNRCWLSTFELNNNTCEPSSGSNFTPPDYHQDYSEKNDICTKAGLGHLCFDMDVDDIIRSPDGKVFSVTATSGSIRWIWQLYPSISYVSVSAIKYITVVEDLLGYLAIAGRDSSNFHRMILKDISTGKEIDIFNAEQVEVYHMGFGKDGKIWFDGHRFSDNTFVVGMVDSTSGNKVTFLSNTNVRIENLVTF